MTHAEFLGRLRTIAGNRYCVSRVETTTGGSAGARVSIRYQAYIADVGHTVEHQTPEMVLAEIQAADEALRRGELPPNPESLGDVAAELGVSL